MAGEIELLAEMGGGFFLIIGAFVVVIGGGVFIWWSGFLNNYDHRVLLFKERANGFDFAFKKGRFVSKTDGSGKFEIWYGIGDKVTFEAPMERFVQTGGWIPVLREALDDHQPCELKLSKEGGLEIDPAMTPAMKIAFGQQMKESVLRFNKPSLLEKYASHIALFVVAMVLGLAFLIGTGTITKAFADAAGPWNAIADQLANAQIVVHQNATAEKPVSTPPPGFPPGFIVGG